MGNYLLAIPIFGFIPYSYNCPVSRVNSEFLNQAKGKIKENEKCNNFSDLLQNFYKNKIIERVEGVDKNGRTYLILRLENGGNIFVFGSLVSENNWEDLQIGREYSFTTKEGQSGNKLLVEFEPISSVFI